MTGNLDTTRWAVVIPTFNHADDVITCLTSLRDADRTPGRVIVVDDASTEDAVGAIGTWARQAGVHFDVTDPARLGRKASEPWLTIVAAKANSGFSVSCNIGLAHVRDHTDAPFVLLLNNDAAVSKSYFVDLAAGISDRRNVGLATGTIYEWDRSTVWYAGGRFNPRRAVAEHYLEVPADGATRSTDFVCGCTMLIARRVMQQVGLLPEIYSPAYCEDADYSLAVARAGFELAYVPRAIAFHRVGSSLGRADRPPKVIYCFNRNRGYAIRRNFSGLDLAAGIGFMALSKPARALWELVRGRPKSAAAFIRGTAAGLFGRID
ncbi:MAG TPA: glycosyltransferase family 2 protein [Gemmatimonadaceae bacterium]|nr:glycosyltransferase family 2 protein [Gemmatimonadaceae bacterium]